MKQEIVKKIITKTISDYSKIAADFDRTRSKYAWPILREFAGYVQSGDAILDFGCGNGRLLDVLKAEDIVYKGVDPVKELIDIARQKYCTVPFCHCEPRHQMSGRSNLARSPRFARDDNNSIEFKTIDFDVDNFKLDFPDKYFDKIFAIAVFHHIPSDDLRRDVLRELKRILKDEGRIFLTVWNLWRGRAMRNALKFSLLKIFGRGKICMDYGDLYIDYQTADNKIKVQRYHHAFTKRGMKKLAKSAGLKIEKIFYDDKKFNLCIILKK